MDQDHKALWNDIRKRREKWRTFITENFRNKMRLEEAIYDSPFGEKEYKNEAKVEQAIVPIRIPKDDFIDMPPFSPLSCRQPLSARSIGTPFATTKEYHVITPSFEILNSALILERNKTEAEEKKENNNNDNNNIIPQQSLDDVAFASNQPPGEEVEQTPEMIYDALFETVIYSTNKELPYTPSYVRPVYHDGHSTLDKKYMDTVTPWFKPKHFGHIYKDSPSEDKINGIINQWHKEIQCIRMRNLKVVPERCLLRVMRNYANLESLKYLEISNMKLPYGVYRSLVLQLPALRIQTLNIARIKLEHKEILSIVQAIEENSFIKRLDLSYTSFGRSGTEELALMICKNKSIKHLNISSCKLSPKSIAYIYESLYKNNTLLSFNTSHIQLDFECIQNLAHSLLLNKAITDIDLSDCCITPAGCYLLCYSIMKSKSLKLVLLEKNPIGIQGGREVVNLLSKVGNQVEISIAQCNLNEPPIQGLFDRTAPPGVYDLDLKNAVGYVTAEYMLDFFNTRGKISFGYCYIKYNDNIKQLNLEQRLRYDEKSKYSYVVIIDKASEFTIPKDGILHLQISYQPLPLKPIERVEAIKPFIYYSDPSKPLELIQLASDICYYTSDQIYSALPLISIPNRVEFLVNVLPRLIDYDNHFAIIEESIEIDQIVRLKNQLNEFYWFSPSHPTGRYEIDLCSKTDKILLTQLVMKNNEEAQIRSENKLFDLSQHSNMSCFRNERIHKGSLFVLDEDFYNGINDHTGIISFDFISTSRPYPLDKIISWEEVQDLANKLGVITNELIAKKKIELTIDDEDVFTEALKGFKWLLRDCVITTNTLVNIMNSYVPDLFLHLKLDILTFFFPNVIDLENFMERCVRHNLTETLITKIIDVIGILNIVNPVNMNGEFEVNLEYSDGNYFAMFIQKLMTEENKLNKVKCVSETTYDVSGDGQFSEDYNLGITFDEKYEIPTEGVLRFTYNADRIDLALRNESRTFFLIGSFLNRTYFM